MVSDFVPHRISIALQGLYLALAAVLYGCTIRLGEGTKIASRRLMTATHSGARR